MLNIPHLIHLYGQIGLFLTVFFESSFIFLLPGDSLLFTAGVLASRGLLNIWFLIPLFFAATFLGSLLGYYIGERLPGLRKYRLFKTLIRDQDLQKAHTFFDSHGRVTILFSRFVPIVRTFAPVVAGIGKMNYADFIKSNIIGSFIWSTTVTLLGYFLGRRFPNIEHFLPVMVVIVIAISVLPGVFHLARKKIKKKD